MRARSGTKARAVRAMALAALFAACATAVVGYQASRASAETGIGQPFVPSPRFFLDFSPSFRTTDRRRLLAADDPVLRGEQEKAVLMLGQAYLAGDKYAREKAVKGLEYILPTEKEARMRALAPLYETMPRADADALVAELFRAYVQ